MSHPVVLDPLYTIELTRFADTESPPEIVSDDETVAGWEDLEPNVIRTSLMSGQTREALEDGVDRSLRIELGIYWTGEIVLGEDLYASEDKPPISVGFWQTGIVEMTICGSETQIEWLAEPPRQVKFSHDICVVHPLPEGEAEAECEVVIPRHRGGDVPHARAPRTFPRSRFV